MRLIRFLAVLAVFCPGIAGATIYTWATPQGFIDTTSPSCLSVAQAHAELLQGIGWDLATSTGGHQVHWHGRRVSCGAAHAAGDTVHYELDETNTSAGVLTLSETITLSTITDEDAGDDVSGISVQRVAILVGCALMFGFGVVAGRT